ncbi:MAG: DinB family protein [Gemmatimonadaceae bacterium]
MTCANDVRGGIRCTWCSHYAAARLGTAGNRTDADLTCASRAYHGHDLSVFDALVRRENRASPITRSAIRPWTIERNVTKKDQMNEISVTCPPLSEYGGLYNRYVESVPANNLVPYLSEQIEMIDVLLGHLSDLQGDRQYASDKWSVKQVVGHLSHTERMISSCMLRVARAAACVCASPEDSGCTPRTFPRDRTISELLQEFRIVRANTLAFSHEIEGMAWTNTALVGTTPMSARALAYLIAGHTAHHLNILWERYNLR